MFSILKRGLGVFYSSPARLLRFSLNNALRPYLKDELQQDNFELQLWQGIVNIENLELNETMLNKKLNGSVPFYITHARVGKLSMDIPWRKVATDSVRVDIHDVTISISLSPPSSHSSSSDNNKEDVEKYMEKCLEKSLEHSQHIIEESQDNDMDENLGIQSVEELFENIFNNMNVAIHNVKIYIEKGQDNAVLSLNVNTMNLMNEPSHGNIIKKMATIEGLSVDVESPVEMKGNVVKMQEKNSVHFEYEKKENISNVVVFTDLTNGLLNCVLQDNQFYFISHFFENVKNQEKKQESTTNTTMYDSVMSSDSDDEDDMGKSLYESAIADSDEEHINALSNSILFIAPVQTAVTVTPADPMDFTFKLKLKQFNLAMSCKNSPALKHVVEVHDLHFTLHMLDAKTSIEVTVEDTNMSEINGDSRLLLLKFLSTNPKVKPQRFKLSYDKTDRQGQIIEDLKIDMPILYLRWDLKSLLNMVKVFQYEDNNNNHINNYPIGPPKKEEAKGSPSLRSSFTVPPIFNLKIPRVQLYLDFASLQSAKHSISAIDLEISEVRVRKIPIPENSTRKWFIEFDGFNSWIINPDLVKRSFVSIWTVDLEDKPRLELTTQEPSIFNKPIPSMMMDLETVFSHPLFFSYFSKGTRDIMPYRPNNTIDFDIIKQSSGFILDLVFQNVHVELNKSDFAFITMVTSQLSGDSSSASSTIATIGKVELVLLDDIESVKNPNQSPIEFRGDFQEFRLFQSTFIKESRVGSFILINNGDASLLNQDNIPLLRKAPRQLRMDQLFCPPLAVTFPEFELVINQDVFLFESVTVGFKVAAWEQFVNFWIHESEEKEGKSEGSSSSLVELKITNATIFYQPLEIAERTSATIVIAPPRAVFSVGQFYMRYMTDKGMQFNVKNIKLWLKEDFHYLKNSEIWLDMCHPDIASHLKNKSLVEVMSLEDLEIRYETKEKVSEISLNFLRENMSPDSNPFVLSVRPDSFETLLKIFRALAIDIPKEGAPIPKPIVPVQKVDFEIVHAKKLGGNIEFVEDYEPQQEEDQDEDDEIPVRAIPIPKQPQRQQKDLSHSFILFDEEQALGTSPDAVIEKKKRSIDPIEESWEWVGRVAPKKPIVQDNTEKIFPSNIPKSMQIKMNNLVVVIRFMGGKDWRNEEFYIHMSSTQYRVNKALESTQDSVDLQFDIPCITFDTFAPEQHSEWRLYLEIRRMLIEDHVKTSHNKNILTFTRPTSKKTKQLPSPSVQLWCEQNYKGSYKFKFTVKPMRIYLDQDTAMFLGDFFTYSSSDPSPPTEDPPTDPLPDTSPLFDYFETSILDMIVDYKPRMTIGQVYNDIRLGNNIWAIKVVELNKVPITLSSIKLNYVKNSSEFKERIMDTWFKDFKQGGVYNILKGTRIGQPVQICLNIGSGVIDLIKTPVDEYNKGGNVLRGIGVGATSLAQKITVELLNIGASSAITIKKGLTGIDKAITVHPAENLHVSSYASQPENLAEAATQATGNIKNGFSNSLNALYYGGIRNLPSAIIQPAIGTLEALSNLTLGVRNMIDKSEYEKSKEKYKTVTDQQELRKKPPS